MQSASVTPHSDEGASLDRFEVASLGIVEVDYGNWGLHGLAVSNTLQGCPTE